MGVKLTKEEMTERVKFYEENGEAAFITKYNRYKEVIYVYRKKLGLNGGCKTNRKYKLPKIYSKSTFVNFTKEDKVKFIEYYKTHTCEDTGKRYGITTAHAWRSAQCFSLEVYGKPFYKNKGRAKLIITKEEMMERIKFYEENGEAALKNKYKVGKASIDKYRHAVNITHTYYSLDEKREMVEYYKTHTSKETAKKYGYSSTNSAISNINLLADDIGYPKPLKHRKRRHAIDKAEMLERIKFYEENGIEKYTDKYGYNAKHTAQTSILRYCKYLEHM